MVVVLDFYKNNLLTIDQRLDFPSVDIVRPDGTVWVELVDVTSEYKVVKRQKQRNALLRAIIPKKAESFWSTSAKVYCVTPALASNTKGFAAYICPYADNAVHSKMLGRAADIMFTGEMDGCTFGIGMPARDGGVMVAHANAQRHATGSQWKPNFAPQRAEQTNLVRTSGAGVKTVEPGAYRDNAPDGTEFKAVVIGLRDRFTWSFYYQKQQANGGDLRKLMQLVKLN